jgi:hypothetical protein
VHWSHAWTTGYPTRRTGLDLLQPKRLPRCRPIQKMIKTFSISAVFFMTIGVLLATHAMPF